MNRNIFNLLNGHYRIYGATLLAAVSSTYYLLWRIKIFVSTYKRTTYKKPDDCQWLNQNEFETLAYICEIFIPSFENSSVTVEALKKSISQLCQHPNSEILNFLENAAKKINFFQRGARKTDLASLICRDLKNLLSSEELIKFHGLLRLLGNSFGSLILTGYPCPFRLLPPELQFNAINGMREAYMKDVRVIFQAFRKLLASRFLQHTENGGVNELWGDLSYFPDEVNTKSQRCALNPRLKPTIPDASVISDLWELQADVIVVGSGAGGGTLAAQLVKCGLRVIVLDKGGYYHRDDFRGLWREQEAAPVLLESGMLLTTKTGSVGILAATCLGGGTTINWAAALQTPPHVCSDWVASGLPQFQPDGAFSKSLRAVSSQVNVNTRCSHRLEDGSSPVPDNAVDPHFTVNGNNELLWSGAKKLGYSVAPIPRNVKDCVNCGNCPMGCPYESKQSTLTAFLEPLSYKVNSKGQRLLQVIPYANVRRVLLHEGKAEGVEGVVSQILDDSGKSVKLPLPLAFRFKAMVVVSSAGSLHTPALLLRSGLRHPKIGKHLSLHPVTTVLGLFSDKETRLHEGVCMGVVVHPPPPTPPVTATPPATTAGGCQGLEIAVEGVPIFPGSWGSVCPWPNALAMRAVMTQYRHAAIFCGIPRDRSQASNCVTLSASGEPQVDYSLTRSDEALILSGLCVQFRIMLAAGAFAIFPNAAAYPWFVPTRSGSEAADCAALEQYLERLVADGLQRSNIVLMSAHQMSSCRMSASCDQGPVKPTGETWEVENLYVADASLLPTSLGINPMVTIEAMAHMVSGNIAERLGLRRQWEEKAYAAGANSMGIINANDW